MANTAPTTGIPTWTVGDRLAKALHHSGISVQEMAEYLGISRNTIGNYIAGRTTPRRATVMTWALRCGVPYEWVAEGVEPADPTPPTGGLISGESSSACTPLAPVVAIHGHAA